MTSAESQILDAFLEIAGKHVTSQSTARRHLRTVRTAHAAITDPSLRERLANAEQRILDGWGDVTADAGNSLLPKPIPVAVWITTRKDKRRTFDTLQISAEALLQGECSISMIHARSFAQSKQMLTSPVNLEQYRRWLLQLGLAVPLGNGRYGAGPCAAEFVATKWSQVEAEMEARKAGRSSL